MGEGSSEGRERGGGAETKNLALGDLGQRRSVGE